jgi:hypothetical protein
MSQDKKARLKELSLRIFGSRSRWEKIRDRRKGSSYVEELPENSSAYKKAKRKWEEDVAAGKEVGEFKRPTRKVTLKPTDDQMIAWMETVIRVNKYESLQEPIKISVIAKQLKEGQLDVPLSLVVTAEEKDEVQKTWQEMPQELSQKVASAWSLDGGVLVNALALLKALTND